MIEKIDIQEFLTLSKEHPVLDVRSPGEYLHAHIPDAISFPLFNDSERAIVGTAYKQESREAAIKKGVDFFGSKMGGFISKAEEIIKNSDNAENKILLIHCWRGGMRSAAVAWLLDLYGFKIYTLKGGYKAFRNFVLNTFNDSYSFKLLGGYTGSGKTQLLTAMVADELPVVDLEKLANHKGSAFGALGEDVQPTQEMFENILALELYYKKQTEQPIWLEDESQRIGKMMIPKSIWDQMRKSKIIFVDIPFDERLKYLVSTYGSYKKELLVAAIMRIQKRLGGLETKNAINFLLENNIDGCFSILLKYYDKLYKKGLENREVLSELLTVIACGSVTTENIRKLPVESFAIDNI